MTLTVNLTATQGQGVDFNAYLAEHFDGFVPYGMPMFNAAADSAETTQIVHLATPEVGAEAQTRIVALEGQDFTYTFSNHTISGTIETIRLGTLGAAWDATAGDVALTNGLLTTASTAVTLSGFNITNAVGVAGAVHGIVAGLMGGGPSGGTADASGIVQAIWGQAHNVIGSAGADVYSGTRFGDSVQGRNGDDNLSGLRGNDLLQGGGGADTLAGATGADTLAGGAGNDSLLGGQGADVLQGNQGADVISGGLGSDVLTGGRDADSFVFASRAEVIGDRITDFSLAGGDTINLSRIDASSAARGNQAFDFIGRAAFSGEAGELRIVLRNGETRVQADLNGDGRADFALVLTGEKILTAEDFVL